jgi:ubiquitin-conjugating enzyme E2 S
MRRIAADHASLHTNGLPPNYLFPSSKEDSFADLTSLSVLLAGPEGTPFASGLFHLDLHIPATYPASPPTAHFRTKIFHPNVDPANGAVCVDTLKRDWKSELTLRDVLVTISCLLVYPNAASALNAEAGRLMEEDFVEFERKAGLWARMHASVPPSLKGAVEEARRRGEDKSNDSGEKQKVGRGKKRRETADEALVFVREDGEEKTQERIETFEPASEIPPFATPDPFSGKLGQPTAFGLGLDLKMTLDSSILMDVSTPTQPPALPPRRRKNPMEEFSSVSATVPSFSTVLSTPTPNQTGFLSENSGTTTPKAPEPKRQRLSPPGEPQLGKSRSGTPQVNAMSNFSCLDWLQAPPTSPPEAKKTRQAREISEYRRLKAAGFCIKRYNSGRFGPRKGIERL